MPRILSIVTFLLVVFAPGIAAAGNPVADNAGMPATPEAWLAQMLDARKNGAAFKDPAAFAEWLDAVTEPRFMTAVAAAATAPATYPKVLADAIDPAAVRNWSEFTDPQLYLRWLLASANPAFQQAIVTRMTNPDKMKHWLEAMNRPETIAPVLAGFAKAPTSWTQAPMNPGYYAPALKLAQPATPIAWFGAMAGGIGRQAGNQEWLKLPAARIPATSAAKDARYRY